MTGSCGLRPHRTTRRSSRAPHRSRYHQCRWPRPRV